MSPDPKSIIFSGGIFRDLVAYTERFPKVGETIFGSKFQTGFGGKSANQVSSSDPLSFLRRTQIVSVTFMTSLG